MLHIPGLIFDRHVSRAWRFASAVKVSGGNARCTPARAVLVVPYTALVDIAFGLMTILRSLSSIASVIRLQLSVYMLRLSFLTSVGRSLQGLFEGWRLSSLATPLLLLSPLSNGTRYYTFHFSAYRRGARSRTRIAPANSNPEIAHRDFEACPCRWI